MRRVIYSYVNDPSYIPRTLPPRSRIKGAESFLRALLVAGNRPGHLSVPHTPTTPHSQTVTALWDYTPSPSSPGLHFFFLNNMAPIRNNTDGTDRGDNRGGITKSDRKTRKPLVEKKRRARINESLQELRVLTAEADLQSKMENAEVLEMTVKRVESILLNRAQEVDAVNREACERFAAGYIQCMHDVHTFVSSSPGIDPTVAAELLNHLLESMPLNDEDRLRMLLPPPDTAAAAEWPASPASSPVSPAPSTTSTDDLCCSDLDETDSEQSHVSSSEEADSQDVLSLSTYSKSMWRPW